MLNNPNEYAAMHAVEESHWWYRSLHRKVWERIANLPIENIHLLDAGCGTGGFLLKCKLENLNNATGFDFNTNAVEFSKNRGLNVQKADIKKISELYPSSFFDVVVCNDVLYQFEKDEIIQILIQIQKILKPGGIFITNNQAFEIFRGTHDIAVGAKIRFLLADFEEYMEIVSKLRLKEWHYWSILLSPIILTVRALQRLKMQLGFIKITEVKSDIGPNPSWVNKFLFFIIKWEEKLLPKARFGSSLFMVFEKK
jgi:SAM-dependent methyltransferase